MITCAYDGYDRQIDICTHPGMMSLVKSSNIEFKGLELCQPLKLLDWKGFDGETFWSESAWYVCSMWSPVMPISMKNILDQHMSRPEMIICKIQKRLLHYTIWTCWYRKPKIVLLQLVHAAGSKHFWLLMRRHSLPSDPNLLHACAPPPSHDKRPRLSRDSDCLLEASSCTHFPIHPWAKLFFSYFFSIHTIFLQYFKMMQYTGCFF